MTIVRIDPENVPWREIVSFVQGKLGISWEEAFVKAAREMKGHRDRVAKEGACRGCLICERAVVNEDGS
jgi:hypothetical protein